MRLGTIWLSALISLGALGNDLALIEHSVTSNVSVFPSFFDLSARARNFCVGTVERTKGSITCDVSKLKTGIGGRDSHMLEDLEAKKYPTASLKYESHNDSFVGELTLRGVTKPVSGKIKNSIELEFQINLKEFEIPLRNYKGLGVQPVVTIKATAKLPKHGDSRLRLLQNVSLQPEWWWSNEPLWVHYAEVFVDLYTGRVEWVQN